MAALVSAARAEPGTRIRFDHLTVNTSRYAPPALTAGPAAGGDAAELGLVQLAGIPKPSQIEGLGGLGLRVIGYLPDNAFLVRGPSSARRRAVNVGLVRWEGPYRPEYRALPALRTSAEQAGPERVSLTLLAAPSDAGAQPLAACLARDLGAVVLWHEVFPAWDVYRVTVPVQAVAGLLEQPDLIWIEPSPTYRLHGERAARLLAREESSCPATGGYADDLARFGVDGSGVLVQVMDSGLDQGNASNLPGSAHPDLVGRIHDIFNATSDPSGSDPGGHGTLNAGILLGTAATRRMDADGFLLGQGIAPGARVYATKIFNNAGLFDKGIYSFAALARFAYQAGATISNNSWGSSTIGLPAGRTDYNIDSAVFDQLTRDANLAAEGNQQLLFVFSAGNEGPAADTLNAPATAKNVVAVGASENCDADGTDRCGNGPGDADSPQDVARFSSRGPTDDGRLGPTLVAVGTHVQGPASTAADYTGSGLCDVYWPAGQTEYARSSGTSHSAPLVSGAAALFTQQYRLRTGRTPSPALVRASLVNACEDMAGGGNGSLGVLGHRPDPEQGWGRLHLPGLLGVAAERYDFDQEALLRAPGERWSVAVQTVDPSQPLRVTLAWTDPAALANANPTLINDLDLVVRVDGRRFLGNVFDQGVSVPGGQPDRLHTLESVVVGEPAGLVLIEVVAHRIVGDGVPGNGEPLDQDFAIAVRNGTDQSQRGFVYLERDGYPCSAVATARLSDAGLRGSVSSLLRLSSLRTGDRETIAMLEDPPGSGFFAQNFTLAAGVAKLDGVLQVEHGDTIVARYDDSDAGGGIPGSATDSAIIDCLPPAIGNVRILDLDDHSARVVWETNEPAMGETAYGPDCGFPQVRLADADFMTRHEALLLDLAADTAYEIVLTAADAVGNVAVDDRGGACYRLRTGIAWSACVFEDNGNNGLAQWTADAPWGVVAGRFLDSPSGPYGNQVDASLVSVPFSLAELVAPTLSFVHRYAFEEGRDFGRVEIAADGAAWREIGAYTGERSVDEAAVLDLAPFAHAEEVRVRFRVVTDAAGTRDGWSLDEIRVCEQGVAFRAGTLSADRTSYRCQDRMVIRVMDLDLVGRQQISVQAKSLLARDITVPALSAAALVPGRFIGYQELSGEDSPPPSLLRVVEGDTVELRYLDLDDGMGVIGPVYATAEVDCTPPAIADVRAQVESESSVIVTWDTDEPADSRVVIGTACPGTAAVEDAALVSAHSLRVAGLEPNTVYHFAVASADAAGNVGLDDNAGQCYRLTTGELRRECAFADDIESGPAQWVAQAPWGTTTVDWRSPVTCWTDSPSGTYANFADTSLATVDFDLRRAEGAVLRFWHRHALENGPDTGRVQVSADSGATWSDALRTFTGLLDPWTVEAVDLSAWDGRPAVRVRFRLISDDLVTDDGWYLDDVSVCWDRLVSHEARIETGRPVYRCADTLDVTVIDLGAGEGPIQIELQSAFTGDVETLELAARPGDPAFHEGSIALVQGPVGAPPARNGVLAVRHGDQVRIRYADDDDGSGAAFLAQHTVAVDCVPPEVTNVAVVDQREDSVTMEWTTSEPTTGVLEVGLVCAERPHTATDPVLGLHHSVTVGGLEPFRRHRAAVRAFDEAGNERLEDNGGACYEVLTGHYTCLLEDDMELQTAYWRRLPPWQRVTEASSSPITAWTDSPAPTFYANRTDVSLWTRPIDLSQTANARLIFQHKYQFQFDRDFGRVEVSTDGGVTWPDLLMAYTGEAAEWREERLDLSAWAGMPSVQVRFRLVSDAFEVRDGWHVDDVSICTLVVPAPAARLLLDGPSYRCGQTMRVTVSDADLAGAGRTRATVSARLTGDVEEVFLLETDAGSGSFVGYAFTDVGPGVGPGVLRVGSYDTVVARFVDADDGGGASRVRAATVEFVCDPQATVVASLVPAVAVAPVGGTVALALEAARIQDGGLPVNAQSIDMTVHYDPALLFLLEEEVTVPASAAFSESELEVDANHGILRLRLSGRQLTPPRRLASLPFRFLGASGDETVVGLVDADLRAASGARFVCDQKTSRISAGTPPRAVNVRVPDPARAAGIVPVVFDLVDLERHPASVQVDYRLVGTDAYRPAADSGQAPTSGLATSPTGVTHLFYWNALRDIETTTHGTPVTLRVTPADPEPGVPGYSDVVFVNAAVFGTGMERGAWALYE